jgi:phosphoribosyl-AMP cyclohydrolase
MTALDAQTPTTMTPRWNEQGLIPAVAQDHETGEVLMVAWMNAESLALTLSQRQAIYWSRSRQALWRKGETSGSTQELIDIKLDCDGDTLLLQVQLLPYQQQTQVVMPQPTLKWMAQLLYWTLTMQFFRV